MQVGSEIHIQAHSTDAHSGVAVTVNEAGTATALTVAATDIISITDYQFTSVAGGDCKLESFTATGTITLFRATLGANGSLISNLRTPLVGLRGGTLQLTAAAGVVDLVAQGYVSK